MHGKVSDIIVRGGFILLQVTLNYFCSLFNEALLLYIFSFLLVVYVPAVFFESSCSIHCLFIKAIMSLIV